MKIEFIAIGSELLSLDRSETNSLHVQKSLRRLGTPISRKIVIGDDKIEIENTIKESLNRADVLILSGGLGPTVDDLTVETVAGILGRKTEFRPEAWEKIKNRFSKIKRIPNEGDKKQAYLVEEASILENTIGQAPGEHIQIENKHIFLLPGVPTEFKALVDNGVLPVLEKISPNAKPVNVLMFKFAAIPESELDHRISSRLSHIIPLEGEEFIITTKPGAQTVSIVTRLTDEKLKERKDVIEKAFMEEFPENYYATEDKTLEDAVGSLLSEKKLRLSVAESCTGGLLADRITDIPGASDYFFEGLVTYHNDAKRDLLGVSEKTLETHGAVSAETAREMCENLREKTGADIALSITGIAGPGGGTEEKPVGTVFIGITDKNGTDIVKRNISVTRRFFKEWVTSVALNLIRLHIIRYH